MLDRIRKFMVLGLFCGTVAGVWALGAIKAELDHPSSSAGMRVDPAIVRAALLADPNFEASLLPDGAGTTYLLAS